jgi:hypothetical protein
LIVLYHSSMPVLYFQKQNKLRALVRDCVHLSAHFPKKQGVPGFERIFFLGEIRKWKELEFFSLMNIWVYGKKQIALLLIF